MRYEAADGGYIFAHHEELVRLHSNLYKDRGYPTGFRDMLSAVPPPSSYGAYARSSMDDLYFAIKRLSKVHENVTALNQAGAGPVDAVHASVGCRAAPGRTAHRALRALGAGCRRTRERRCRADARDARTASMQQCVDENVALFRARAADPVPDPGEKIVYIGAFNLVRQCMLPPTGQTTRNFYVFSRNPVWGWGHGHQVMHESLSMIPYVYLDARSAEESQRIYMDQQYEDGLIAYRHGPRGPQVYPHEGVPTTSAPFFTWTNWEMYTVTKNRAFLKDAYASGARYIRYMETERDRDGDGMYEWGPYGIIENVRDGWNVVFQLFSEGTDEGRDISHELDVLDLTAEMANEMYYAATDGPELGDTAGVREWSAKFDRTAGLINRYMWDPQDRFYYNVSMDSNSFVFEGASLKRKELIGFLPMWAHVASKQQAAELVKHLTDPEILLAEVRCSDDRRE